MGGLTYIREMYTELSGDIIKTHFLKIYFLKLFSVWGKHLCNI